MILTAFFRALGQLTDPRFLGVLALGLGLTVALFLGVYVVVVTLVGWLLPDTISLPWLGEIDWAGTALAWASVPLMLLLSAVLMVPVASAFVSMFLDTVADAVERAHYPHLPPARSVGLAEGLGDALRFLGLLVAVNLGALVLYLLLPPLAPLIFWAVNGVLLGREYAQLVALRRGDAASAAAFRRRHRGTIFAAGVLMAVPLTIPVVNLLVPILGAATFTHLYHGLSGAAARPARSG